MSVDTEILHWIAGVLRVEPTQVDLKPLVGGRSNLTWRVLVDGQTVGVFRQPPLGERLRTAHDLGREFRMLQVLGPTGFPVPSPLALLERPDSTSYLMSYVEGRVLADAAELRRWDEGRHIMRALESSATVLAQLHSYLPTEMGMDKGPKASGYVGRQLRRWLAQWLQVPNPLVTNLPELHEQLLLAQPEPGQARVVHGDFHFGNLMLSGEGTVAAVLDWELATVGEAAADMGSYLAYLDADLWEWRLSAGSATTEDWKEILHVLRSYGDHAVPQQLRFHLALAHWKLACIGEGIIARNSARALAPRDIDVSDIARKTRAHAASAANLLEPSCAAQFDHQLGRATSQLEKM
jgi:aminoglycoside phosphotransferase (APT) family kinase protein